MPYNFTWSQVSHSQEPYLPWQMLLYSLWVLTGRKLRSKCVGCMMHREENTVKPNKKTKLLVHSGEKVGIHRSQRKSPKYDRLNQGWRAKAGLLGWGLIWVPVHGFPSWALISGFRESRHSLEVVTVAHRLSPCQVRGYWSELKRLCLWVSEGDVHQRQMHTVEI